MLYKKKLPRTRSVVKVVSCFLSAFCPLVFSFFNANVLASSPGSIGFRINDFWADSDVIVNVFNMFLGIPTLLTQLKALNLLVLLLPDPNRDTLLVRITFGSLGVQV